MKITFLGTGHGVPEEKRFCQSILVEVGENGYLIDAGAPVIDLLIRRKYDLSKLRCVFITHMHGDHMYGLVGLIDLCTWYFKQTDFDVFLPEQSGIDALEGLFSALHNRLGVSSEGRIRFRRMEQNTVYENGEEYVV